MGHLKKFDPLLNSFRSPLFGVFSVQCFDTKTLFYKRLPAENCTERLIHHKVVKAFGVFLPAPPRSPFFSLEIILDHFTRSQFQFQLFLQFFHKGKNLFAQTKSSIKRDESSFLKVSEFEPDSPFLLPVVPGFAVQGG